MFQIEYKSKNGSIIFGGGNNPSANIISLDGFEFPARSYTNIEFAGENGITTIGKKDMQRTMTITGTVRGDQYIRDHMCKVLYEDGELYCIFDNVRRKIACKCTNLDSLQRAGRSNISKFAFQLVADYPYFKDFFDTDLPLFREHNTVTDTFTLPCVFTERISSAEVNNIGDKPVYPVIHIENGDNEDSSGAGLTVQNLTTGAEIILPDYIMRKNEKITVDLARRRITSSESGNITYRISTETPDLSKFYLDVGINELCFVNGTNQKQINAHIVFSPEYYTAMR